VAALGDPLTRLVDFILQWTAKRRLESTVVEADPTIAALVTGQKKYLHALDDQVRVAQHELDQIIDIIDRRTPAPQPIDAAGLFAWATETARALRGTRDRLATYMRVLDGIAAAHHALAEAVAASRKDRGPALGRSIGASSQAQLELNWLHETIAQGTP
jgi:hypothetical protein